MVIMEYSCLDFGLLEDFVHFVDAEFDFSSFVDVVPCSFCKGHDNWARVSTYKRNCPQRPQAWQHP